MSSKKRPHRRMSPSPYINDQTSQTLSGSPPQRSNAFSAAPKRRANIVGSRAFQTRFCISTKISTCAWAALCRMQQDIIRKVLPSPSDSESAYGTAGTEKGHESFLKSICSSFSHTYTETQHNSKCPASQDLVVLPWNFLVQPQSPLNSIRCGSATPVG